MLGKFQKSELRIEVKATESQIHDSLLKVEQLKQWFMPWQVKNNLGQELNSGDIFSSYIGTIEIKNKVEIINRNCFRLILSGGIDGYQEWCWGNGWVQSRLEGISVLPLNLAQSFNLWRLKSWLTSNQSN
jgi:hypothetical protein